MTWPPRSPLIPELRLLLAARTFSTYCIPSSQPAKVSTPDVRVPPSCTTSFLRMANACTLTRQFVRASHRTTSSVPMATAGPHILACWQGRGKCFETVPAGWTSVTGSEPSQCVADGISTKRVGKLASELPIGSAPNIRTGNHAARSCPRKSPRAAEQRVSMLDFQPE